MKILIHNERADVLGFLREHIINHGYKAGIAENPSEIIDMLSSEQYNVVLTNGGMKELNSDQRSLIKASSTFVIGITAKKKFAESLACNIDMYLQSPFEASKLWQALKPAAATTPT